MAAGDELPILYARDAGGSYRFIEDVANGDACGCFCPACGQPMRARNAGRILRHSFAHQPGATCTWAVEAVITELAKQALEETGLMMLPVLTYHNAVTDKVVRLSDARLMRVTGVETVKVTGRQTPCLSISVAGGNAVAEFALCVCLRKRLNPEQAQELCEGRRGVMLVDLGLDLKQQRRLLGKHYDRDELIKSYQDKDFIASILTDSESYISSWVLNGRRKAEEERSLAEREEIDRREEEARRKREEELAREREELERETAELKRRKEERLEREAREGIIREPNGCVTDRDEYDVRMWDPVDVGSGNLAENEMLVRNGDLLALVVMTPKGDQLRIRTHMSVNAIDEISWNLEALRDGFDSFVLVLSTGFMKRYVSITEQDGDGTLRFHLNGHGFCCALQGLVSRDVTVLVNTSDGQSWQIEKVNVREDTVSLKRLR